MKKRKLWIALSLILAFVLTSSAYISARSIGYYNLNLPRFGRHVELGGLVKTNESSAVNNATFIGGNYTLGARVHDSATGEALTNNMYITGSGRATSPYYNPSAQIDKLVSMHLRVYNGNIVRVAVEGSWSPDSY